MSVCGTEISPRAIGRRAVRAILESISLSTKQFTAKAAPASSQIPKVAGKTTVQLGKDCVASSMPITAQNTAKEVTLGLVSAQYCATRFGIAVVMGMRCVCQKAVAIFSPRYGCEIRVL